MSLIDIDALHTLVHSRLTASVLARIEMRVVGDSGLQIRINGQRCLTSIGVWPSGCCDVDFIYVESEQGHFRHFEFRATEEAVAPVASEIQMALERSQ